MHLSTVTFIVCISFAAGLDLPDNFKKCSRSDPNFNACIFKALDDLAGILVNGVPALNIPPTEPLEIDRIVIDQGNNNSNFNLKSTMTNVKVTGLSETKLKRLAIKLDKFRIKVEFYSERTSLISDYRMSGQIIFVPISGEGRANTSMLQLATTHELKGEYFTKPDGETYINVTDYRVKFKPKLVTFLFTNLFNGDKLLGDTVNQFLNENWKSIFSEVVGPYEEFFADKFKGLANNVFQNIPTKRIFLD